MRSSPNSSGQGSSEATHSVAVEGLVAEGIELTTVARELLALRLDDLGRGLRREPLVREHALGAGDFLLEPVDLGSSVAPCLHALGVEDALLVLVELDLDAAPRVDARRFLDPVERAEVACEALVRLGPGRDDEPRLARGQVRPD